MEPAPKGISGKPAGPVPLPAELVPVARDDDVRCVWINEAGGRTFRLAGSAGVRYAKWLPDGAADDLEAEALRLGWAARFVPVPRVLVLDPGGRYLVTAGIDGESAVARRWRASPVTAARAIGEGLRRLHDALPSGDCPFDWSPRTRIRLARLKGSVAPVDLEAAPPVDRLVVAHGDACAPNTLLGDDGRFLAHVDLGASGLADRWADLAVATMSLGWNFQPPPGVQLEAELLAAYGVEPDSVRTAYYRALWNAT